MWMKSGTSPGASFVRSGTHTPFVVTDAPVSSSIYMSALPDSGGGDESRKRSARSGCIYG